MQLALSWQKKASKSCQGTFFSYYSWPRFEFATGRPFEDLIDDLPCLDFREPATLGFIDCLLPAFHNSFCLAFVCGLG